MASPSAYVGIEEGYNRGLSCDYVVQGRRVKDLPLGRITKNARLCERGVQVRLNKPQR